MGDMVIAAYRPKPGHEADLLELIRDHTPFLRRHGLATDRPSLLMQNRDGVLLEVFEWHTGAIARAHEHHAVLELWGRYAEVCDYVPLHELPETRDLFAQFVPVEP